VKVLFLSKRRPQNKDLYTRPSGRFFNIPMLLAATGMEVYLVLGSYESEPEFSIVQDGMTIHSRRMFPNFPRFYNSVKALADKIAPDVVVGFSDTWFGIVAAGLARRTRARLVIDAYDNYESYLPRAKPLHWLWHRALSRADGLTAAGPQLLELLGQYNAVAQRLIVPMAADDSFKPIPASECRPRLQLPQNRKLVGYLGTADETRGFDTFQDAIIGTIKERDDFDLVISGRSSVALDVPKNRLHNLGYIDDELMPDLINSCDLLVSMSRDSAFGNYSYPVKIYEALACERPVLASDTPPARWILKNEGRCLAQLGDADNLASKIKSMLDQPVIATKQPKSWVASAAIFSDLLHLIQAS
jgi:glycosyltransferase involved in cell wall biosynthesis